MEDFEYDHNEAEAKICHETEDNIICPYCGYEYEYEESREMVPINLTSYFKFDVECRQCKMMFSAIFEFEDEIYDDEDTDHERLIFSTYHEDQNLFS